MEKDEPANIYALYEPSSPTPTGEDPQGDRESPFPTKSRNGSTPTSTSQRMTSCAMPKTEPAGDALQSTALPTDDDDDAITIEQNRTSSLDKKYWIARMEVDYS